MSMETPAASLPVEVKPATPAPCRQGRPPKYAAPTDGAPMSREVQFALKERERKRLAYQANPEHYRAQVNRNFKTRMEKMREELLKYEELKRAVAGLATAAAVA